MKTISCFVGASVVFAILDLAIPHQAVATVMDYHDFVQSYGDTLVQYDFDGSTEVERREDKKGSNDLVQKTTTSYDLNGFDSSSQAVEGGFFTTSAIGLPTTVSFEAIIKPEAVTSGHYLAGAYSGNDDRSYFGVQDNYGTDTDRLFAAVGTSYGNSADIVSPYDAGDWYYFAVTMSYDSGSNATTMNTYVANLSDGATSLVHTSTNVVKAGTFQTSIAHGIGLLNHAGSASSSFVGTIDEISFYSGVKDQDFFQANLDRIATVPEPSSLLLALLALGGLGIVIRSRR